MEKKAKDRLERTIYDELTGVYTKSLLWPRLEEELDRCRRYQIPLTLMILDLDQFKMVNDVYGHRRGDEILREVGRIIRNTLRKTDLVFRYGGDEFVIMLPHTPRQDAEEIASRILRLIRHHTFHGDPPLRITASLGMAFHPDDARNEKRLFDIADRRLMDAKRQGGDSWASRSEEILKEGLLLHSSRLLEREELQIYLEQFMNAFYAGRTTVLLVRGDWGSGKTRAWEEAVNLARLRGSTVMAVQAYPEMARRRYGLIRELLDTFLRERDRYRTLLNRLPEPVRQDLQKLLSPAYGLRSETEWTESSLYRLHQAVLMLFRQLDERGVILAIDDFHYGDPPSVEMLQALVQLATDYPLGLILTESLPHHREVDWEAPHVATYQVQLRPLSFRGVRNLLMLWLKWEPPEEFIQYVYQMTGGNLTLLERLIQGLYESGFLRYQNGEWTLRTETPAEAWPASVDELFHDRVRRLSGAARQLAELIAVLGGQADVHLLQAATGQQPHQIEDAVRELVELGLLWESVGNTYRFRYERLTSMIYDALSQERRGDLHRRVALAMERTFESLSDRAVELLAYHYQMAGDPQKSMHYYVESARLAQNNYAYADAIRFYEEARKIAEKVKDNEAMLEILINLAKLYGYVKKHQLQHHIAQRAKELVEGLGRDRLAADVAYLEAQASFHLGQHREALDLLDRYFPAGSPTRDMTALLARSLKAQILLAWGQGKRAQKLMESIVWEAQTEELAPVYYEAISHLGSIYMHQLRLKRAQRLFADALNTPWPRSPLGSAQLLYELGRLERHVTPLSRAQNPLMEAFQISYTHGFSDTAARSAMELSELALHQGFWDTAYRWAAAAQEQAYRSLDPLLRALSEVAFWSCALDTGDGGLLLSQAERLQHYADILRQRGRPDPRAWPVYYALELTWVLSGRSIGRSCRDELKHLLREAQLEHCEPLRRARIYTAMLVLDSVHTRVLVDPFPEAALLDLLRQLERSGAGYLYAQLVLAWSAYLRRRGIPRPDMTVLVRRAKRRAQRQGALRLASELRLEEVRWTFPTSHTGPSRRTLRDLIRLDTNLSTLYRIELYQWLLDLGHPGPWLQRLEEIAETALLQWRPPPGIRPR